MGLTSVFAADVGRNAMAAFADRNADAERDVHDALLDRDELRRVFGHQYVRADKEVDPAGAEVESQSDGASAVVDHRIASRKREPTDRVKIDRTGDVVEGLVLPEPGRIQQADADFVTPHLVFESGVDRGP